MVVSDEPPSNNKFRPKIKKQFFFDLGGLGTWEWNLKTNELFVNEQWLNMMGLESIRNKRLYINDLKKVLSLHDLSKFRLKISQMLNGEKTFFEQVLRIRKDSKAIDLAFVLFKGKLLKSEGFGSGWAVGTSQDVTDMSCSLLKLDNLAKSLPGIIYTYKISSNGRDTFTYVSDRVREFYGITPEEAMSDSSAIFDLILEEDVNKVKASITSSYENLTEWSCEYRIKLENNIRWVRGVAMPELVANGDVVWNGMVFYIDKEKALEHSLKKLSTTDELTGLYNRRYLFEKLNNLIEKASRSSFVFSAVLIDIDFFKKINDNYGHITGDEVLKDFSKLLTSRIRSTDVAARTGGEEFIVLMPDSDGAGAFALANDIRRKVQRHVFSSRSGVNFNITISSGLLTYDYSCSMVLIDFLHELDRLLYAAKESGRNRIVTHLRSDGFIID